MRKRGLRLKKCIMTTKNYSYGNRFFSIILHLKFHIKLNGFSLLVKIKNIKENSYFVLSGWKQILNSFWNLFILHTINKLTYLGFKNNFLVPISIKCGHIHHTFLKAFLRCVSQIFFLYICYFKLRRSELSCYNFVYSILITI